MVQCPNVKNTAMVVMQFAAKEMMDYWVNNRLGEELANYINAHLRRLDMLFTALERYADDIYHDLRNELVFDCNNYEQLIEILFRYYEKYVAYHAGDVVLSMDSIINTAINVNLADVVYAEQIYKNS